MDEPTDLRLVEEFLNTLDRRTFRRREAGPPGGDAFVTPAALGTWLAEHGLVDHGLVDHAVRETGDDLRLAREIRDALREMVTPGEKNLDKVNAALAAIPVRVEATGEGTLRVVAADAKTAALAGLLETAVRRSADGTWHRLKACAAPDCRWVFYDDSRNGAGRWCSMSACGNRTKTARYRAKKAG